MAAALQATSASKPKSIELFTFTNEHKIQYRGFCRLEINNLSHKLVIKLENETSVDAPFTFNLIKNKNMLFVVGPDQTKDIMLVFLKDDVFTKVFKCIYKIKKARLSTAEDVFEINRAEFDNRFLNPLLAETGNKMYRKIVVNLISMDNFNSNVKQNDQNQNKIINSSGNQIATSNKISALPIIKSESPDTPIKVINLSPELFPEENYIDESTSENFKNDNFPLNSVLTQKEIINSAKAELLTFNDQKTLQYRGFCMVEIDKDSEDLLLIELENDKSFMFVPSECNFIKVKNLLCIAWPETINDMMIKFSDEKYCKKFYNFVINFKKSIFNDDDIIPEINENEFNKRFRDPLFMEMKNDSFIYKNFKDIILYLYSTKKNPDNGCKIDKNNEAQKESPKKKEEISIIEIMDDEEIVLTDASMSNCQENNQPFETSSSSSNQNENSLRKRLSRKRTSATQRSVSLKRNINVKKRCFEIFSKKSKENVSQKISSKSSDATKKNPPCPPLSSENDGSLFSSTSQSIIISKENFQLLPNKKGEPNQKIEIFVSNNNKNLVRSYSLHHRAEKYYICHPCNNRGRLVTASLIRKDGAGDDEFYIEMNGIQHLKECKPRKPKEIEAKTNIFNDFYFLPNQFGSKNSNHSKLIIINFNGSGIDYDFHLTHNATMRYYCTGCKSKKFNKYNFGANIKQNENGEKFVELEKSLHLCKGKNWKKLGRILEPSKYELKKDGNENDKIIVPCKNESFQGSTNYEFIYERNIDAFLCRNCDKIKGVKICAKIC